MQPFKAAAAAGVAGVMICHAVFAALDSQRPASLSPRVIQNLLRGELGFQGLVLSDDVEMGALAAYMDPTQAVVEAYLAGCDLVLVCHRPELALAGEIDPKLIANKARRIIQCKQGLEPLPPELGVLQKVLADNQARA